MKIKILYNDWKDLVKISKNPKFKKNRFNIDEVKKIEC
jgi:hypothetical protein